MEGLEPGIKLLKEFEGCMLKPYKCSAGVPTIGFGNTYYADGTKVTLQDPPITMAQAQALLQYLLPFYLKPILQKIPKQHLSPNRVSAAISFVWNVGAGAFRSSTFARRWAAGDYQGAADALNMWIAAGTKSEKGLRRRRAAEIALFLK